LSVRARARASLCVCVCVVDVSNTKAFVKRLEFEGFILLYVAPV
jgi:hypothetical protein